MGKITIREHVDSWLGRASTGYTLWPLLPVGIVSGLSAYFSAGVTWINQLGPFGWLLVAMLSFGFLSVALLALSITHEKWVYAKITREKAAPSDAINPIEKEFTKRRILLTDMIRPSTMKIKDKIFTDCELMGPIMILPQSGTEFLRTTFINCNWVVVKQGIIYNAVSLVDVKVRGGDISDATILICENDLETIRKLGVATINRTGDIEIDKRTALTGTATNGK